MPIRLLLTLKLRLLTRSLTAGQRQGSILWATVTGGVVFFLGLMFSPISYLAVTQFGGSGLLSPGITEPLTYWVIEPLGPNTI